MMEGSAIAPPRQVARQGYLIVTVLLGIAGSLIGMAAFSTHAYRVGPLVVEMSVKPSTEGKTVLGIEFAQLGLKAGTAEAKTHSGFLEIKGNVIGIIGNGVAVDAITATKDPATLAKFIQTEGKTAMRKFALRLGLIVLGGGAAGGAAIALVGLKTRRIFQGSIAGVVVFGVLGLLAWQTYDLSKLNGVNFGAPTVASSTNR
jgi:hypothetical protein